MMTDNSDKKPGIVHRIKTSLSNKMFITLLMFSFVLSTAAGGFSFYLYMDTVRSEYASVARNISSTIAISARTQGALRFADDILSIYEFLSEEEVQNPVDPSYRARYQKIMNQPRYGEIYNIFMQFQNLNDASFVYMCAFDKQKQRLIYIFDSSDPEVAGFWEKNEEWETNQYLNSVKDPSANPFFVDKSSVYGYLTTSWKVMENSHRYIVMAMTDLDFNQELKTERQFLLQYALILLVLTVLLDTVIVMIARGTVVHPIGEINRAARRYIADKEHLEQEDYFRSLKIQTGDEIESLAIVIGEMEKELSEYIAHMAEATSEQERMNTELKIAADIQEGLLPNSFPAFPERKEFDIYALMDPAREVGGDFYDFFLTDDDHLALVIADVSGKGIPASLFMMSSMIIIQSLAESGIQDPGEILEEANTRIITNNPAEMFVTVWLGILDLKTGLLKAANGGHEYPVLKKYNGEYELYKDKHGFVLGGMEGSKYQSYEIMLEKEDRLFVYTDGVPESTDQDNRMFGTDRIVQILNEQPSDTAEESIRRMMHGIDAFVQDAPQADDITMLSFVWHGPAETDEITMDALIENVPEVTAFADRILEKAGCPVKANMQIDVAIDELFSNIALYAYAPETGKASVRVEIEENPKAAVITFTDRGIPYNPLDKEEPDITLSAEERRIGGLGIHIVRKTMSDMKYEYKDGQNILTIRKVF